MPKINPVSSRDRAIWTAAICWVALGLRQGIPPNALIDQALAADASAVGAALLEAGLLPMPAIDCKETIAALGDSVDYQVGDQGIVENDASAALRQLEPLVNKASERASSAFAGAVMAAAFGKFPDLRSVNLHVHVEDGLDDVGRSYRIWSLSVDAVETDPYAIVEMTLSEYGYDVENWLWNQGEADISSGFLSLCSDDALTLQIRREDVNPASGHATIQAIRKANPSAAWAVPLTAEPTATEEARAATSASPA